MEEKSKSVCRQQFEAWLLKPWKASDFAIWSVLLICALLFFAPSDAHAQAWVGILDTSRAIDWSLAGTAIQIRTTVCGTPSLTPNNSGAASANGAAVRSAIASCPAGQVVAIPAGSYYIDYVQFGSSGNPVSNVTLRGAGAGSSNFIFTTGVNCTGSGNVPVCLVNASNNFSGSPGNVADWVGGYAKGTTTITLGGFSQGSLGNLHVGSLLILDQQDDGSDTGNVYICQSVGSPGCAIQGGVGNGRPGRGQNQIVRVTSISGSNIGITPGLYASNWRSGQSPGVWFSSALPITGDGVENISLDYTALNGGGVGVLMTNAYGDWVYGVRGINNNRSSHIQLYQSAHITVMSSYFYGSNGTSSSYGVDTGFSSGDNLVVNNVFQHISTGQITEGDEGSVFAYNYCVDDYFTDPGWQQESNYHHSVADMFTLSEGNDCIAWYTDDIHGSSAELTAFRNHFNGRDQVGSCCFGPKTAQTSAVTEMAYTRVVNMIGNILGTAGYHTIYQTAASSPMDPGNGANGNVSVYVFGYSGNQGSCPYYSTGCSGNSTFVLNDTTALPSTMRWGNYDVVNAAVRWDCTEVPTSFGAYSNACPSSHTLPASFVYSSPPSFWGSQPWPSIGPDVTGGNVPNVGGHVYLNPAANCFLNVMMGHTDGSSGVLSFDANTCYPSNPTPPPAAPTNLKAVVH